MNYDSFYERVNWLDREVSLETPLSARNLNKMDSAISVIDNALDTLSAEQNALDNKKADNTALNDTIKNISIADNGNATVTRHDNTTFEVETKPIVTSTLDNSMSDTSSNPVRNKVIKKYVDDNIIAKADNLAYDKKSSRLQLKSGNTVLSSVVIDGGSSPTKYKTMTVRIDLNNSHPSDCATYYDDAIDMVVGSKDWDDFFGHYPCLFKNGKEVGKLNPNNFSKFEDGSDADITSGEAGDVMIAFPRMGVRITKNDNILSVSMTEDPYDPEFNYFAHSRGDTQKDVFYLGAYNGYVMNGARLRSLSNKTPSHEYTMDTFRTLAQANGVGYEQSAFYQLIYRQCMYILKYKNLNSQSVVGCGNVDSSGVLGTGTTDSSGMDSGSTSNMTIRMKLFGIEDFWGNIWEYVDGLRTHHNYSYGVRITTDEFENVDGYKDFNRTALPFVDGGFMDEPEGNNELGFLVYGARGSSSSYFCDRCRIYGYGNVPTFGGRYTSKYNSGIFQMTVDEDPMFMPDGYEVGSRLMYL